ncbi:MAG TPA: TonB-dependent receptor [Steroidobacteraceae bacterium]|nr:TonB-dependent receptor [Steroidobacteraceae bacterium]
MTKQRARRAAQPLARRALRLGTVTPVTAAVLSALYGPAVLADASDPQSPTQLAQASGTVAQQPVETGLQEVTVTATRRAASAQDLPISITAITGAQLQEAGIEDMASLARNMAGVDYTDKGPFGGVNGSTLIIRGLNSEQTSGQLALASPVVPPVATYVDDTPLFVNLRLEDLNRVEILRGPQGTLYGSGSLGGTIRFVQNQPDPSAFDAKAELGVSDTAHTHAPNEEAFGMLNLPVTSTFAIRLNASWAYDAGFINQPNLYVLDSAGIPISADPGNPFSPPVKYSDDGTNAYMYRTARVAALWKPSDVFQIGLNFYYQYATANGFPYAATQTSAYNQFIDDNPADGHLPTPCSPTPCAPAAVPQLFNSPVPAGVDSLSNADNSLEGANDKVDITALTIEYDLGFATLTSDSSYAQHMNKSSDDLTALYSNFGFYQSIYGQDPRTFVQGRDQFYDRPVTQEFRLASKTGGFLDWVGGLFYKDEQSNIQEHEFFPGYLDFYNACSAIYGQATVTQVFSNFPSYCGVGETAYTPGALNYVDGIPIVKDQTYIGDFETHYTDLALFGELTGHVTSAWSVTGGARLFKQTVSQSQQTGLLFDGGTFFEPDLPIANTGLSNSWRKALWKLNTAYQFDKNNLVYVTWSQGFRRGGVNALPPSEPAYGYTTPAALTKLSPDEADNYEIGFKGTIANRVQYSADLYEIHWHNMQEGVQLTPLVLPASINVGDAFSRGAELEVYALVTDHLAVTLDYTYDQTKLTTESPLYAQATPPNTFANLSAPPAAIGTALPGTPKESVAVGLEYAHVQLAGGELRFAINAHYQSDQLPALSATAINVPGYTMLDTRVSFELSHWITTVYANNITNNLGIQSYSDPAIYGNRWQAVVSTPRTIGITETYSFKGH